MNIAGNVNGVTMPVVTSNAHAENSPPAAVYPEPLFGVFADPAFHDFVYQFGCAPDVYIAVFRARQNKLFSNFEPEPSVRQAHRAGAVDRAVVTPRQFGQQGVAGGVVTEKRDIDSAAEFLVHQHTDMLTTLQCAHQLEGSTLT